MSLQGLSRVALPAAAVHCGVASTLSPEITKWQAVGLLVPEQVPRKMLHAATWPTMGSLVGGSASESGSQISPSTQIESKS
jgi:hypothetical protein